MVIEDVVLGSPKSFFQVDHQVDVSHYLMDTSTLHHSRELAWLTPSYCTFSPISLFGFLDFKSNSISFPFIH